MCIRDRDRTNHHGLPDRRNDRLCAAGGSQGGPQAPSAWRGDPEDVYKRQPSEIDNNITQFLGSFQHTAFWVGPGAWSDLSDRAGPAAHGWAIGSLVKLAKLAAAAAVLDVKLAVRSSRELADGG